MKERGTFKVVQMKSKKELKQWAQRIGQAYNKTFINNWEYYPLTEGEVDLILKNLLSVAIPSLIKLITYHDEIVGFLLGFPDASAAMQRHGGRVSLATPFAILDIMNELKKSNWVSLTGRESCQNSMVEVQMRYSIMKWNKH